MGCYINPPDETKEEWLAREATPIQPGEPIPDGWLPICLVDNGIFTAAGVAYDGREENVFNQPDDRRPKQWYAAPIAQLRLVCPIDHYLSSH